MQSLQAVAQKLVDLRGVMPEVNVSSLLATHPVLLLQLKPQQVAKQLQELRYVCLAAGRPDTHSEAALCY